MFAGHRFVVPSLLIAFLASSAQAASFDDGLELVAPAQTRAVAADVAAVLRPEKKHVDARGNEVLVYTQWAGGLPVFGERTVVVYPRGGAPFTVGDLAAKRSEVAALAAVERGAVAVPVEQALSIAAQEIRARGSFTTESVPDAWLVEPTLVMYRDGAGALRCCHHVALPVRERGVLTTREFFVDAKTGEIVDAFSQLFDIHRGESGDQGSGVGLGSDAVHEFPVAAHESSFKLFDGGRKVAISHTQLGTPSADADRTWDSEGTSRATNQRAEVQLYLNFMRIVDYYKTRFDYTWDGQVDAVAHAPNPQTGAPNFNNAYFHPWFNAFFFGDGTGTEGGFDFMGKALDVAGHEFGHGFISKEGPLVYSGESGALNEHVADLFGACIDDDDWLVGDEVTVGASAGKGLRNMQNPSSGQSHLLPPGTTFAQWRAVNRPRPMGEHVYPDHVTRKIVCTPSEDNGGVHINSSIFNRFAYLAATGDGLGSEGLGRQRLADVYVRAMKADLYGQRATFVQFRDALLAAAALELAGDPKKDVYVATMKAAFAKIGL